MNSHGEGCCTGNDEIDLVAVWAMSRPVIARYKYGLLLAPVLFAFLGYALSLLPSPQWGGAVKLQMGRLSASEFIEPADSLVLRLGTADFQDAVLEHCGIPLDSRDAALYRGSLTANLLKSPGVVEIKFRGLSRASVLSLSSATASEILAAHASMLPALLSGPNKKLAEIEKARQDIAGAVKGAGRGLSENRFLGDIASAYLMLETGDRRVSLMEQINYPQLHPTAVISAVTEAKPVYPRKTLCAGGAALFGLVLAFAWVLLRCRPAGTGSPD